MEPHQSTELHVKERANLTETVEIGTQLANDSDFLITVSKYSPQMEEIRLNTFRAHAGSLRFPSLRGQDVEYGVEELRLDDRFDQIGGDA